jgi:RHS repeat-associated protein
MELRTYDHDAVGRLVAEASDVSPPRPYAFDVDDNLLRNVDGESFEYDTAGRILAASGERRFRHDAWGRMTAMQSPKGTRTLWYDGRDRLTRVHLEDDTLVTHEYDSAGRRARTVAEYADRVTEELFYWDGDHLARRVVRRLGSEEFERDERYAWDLERLAPLLRTVVDARGAQRQTYRLDQRQAAIELLDDNGGSLWVGQMDSYGRCRESGQEEGQQPLRLEGQLHDTATGYAHHRFRVYDPQTCRFLTTDPIGLLGGLNPYAYPSDPVSATDPLGLAACHDSGARGVAAAESDLAAQGYTVVGREVTMNVGNPPSRIRADIVATDANGNMHVFEVKNGTGRLTDNQSSAGVFNMNSPANQNGTITTGQNHNFSVGTDNRPGVGPRNSTQNASFNVLKYDV